MPSQRQLEALLVAGLNDGDCPPDERLAAFVLGALSGNEQLSVAAHMRDCPLCQELARLARPPAPRARTLVARLLPLGLAEGRRGPSAPSAQRRFVSADVQVDLSVVATGELWRVTGQATRGGAPLGVDAVTMRQSGRRHTQRADDEGFFTFEGLPAGRYTLTLKAGDLRVQVRNLDLGEGEPS